MALRQILGQIRHADLDYSLIQNNDRIAVGVSGGKDSLLLLYALEQYRRLKQRYDQQDFSVVGIHLGMGFPDMDFSGVVTFMEKAGIEYHEYPTRIYDILQLYPDKDGRIECSRCSTLKKGAMVRSAKEYGCNKTAFAHHADDAIETLFMNLTYGGRAATFQPAMHLSNTGMDFIRPLVYSFEAEIRSTAETLGLPIVQSTCPNDGFTKRQETKELLARIYQQYPPAHENFLRALSNQEQLRLWVKGRNWQQEK
jgi:tRNA 2-thiocytidine biosynthesis protein TtcA